MKYLVSQMMDGKKINTVFDDLNSALAHFKNACQEGRCAAIYNLVS